MSVEYYYLDKESKEYLFLGCGWDSREVFENLLDILEDCISKKKSFNDFIKQVIKKKVFDYFCDEQKTDEFLDEDTKKYSMLPLYNWAYDSFMNRKGIKLYSDETLGDEAMKLLFIDKGFDYEAEKKLQNDYSKTCDINNLEEYYKNKPEDLERKLFDEFEKEHCSTCYNEITKKWEEVPEHDGLNIIDYYFKSLGSLWEFNNSDKVIGVTFERAFAELKDGNTIYVNENNKYNYKEGKIYCNDKEIENFPISEMLSENWHF